ncbi:unnamed protein product [Amoebophrya sp. A25]|nr:unnamed protein product [Amoebophrya sp. A25]|eukprot:GSA25T00024286001.1
MISVGPLEVVGQVFAAGRPRVVEQRVPHLRALVQYETVGC